MVQSTLGCADSGVTGTKAGWVRVGAIIGRTAFERIGARGDIRVVEGSLGIEGGRGAMGVTAAMTVALAEEGAAVGEVARSARGTATFFLTAGDVLFRVLRQILPPCFVGDSDQSPSRFAFELSLF